MAKKLKSDKSVKRSETKGGARKAGPQLRRVILNQTRNIYDRGRFLVGDGITEYEVTEENAKMAVEQGWALMTDDTDVREAARKGLSPVKVIGGAIGTRKVESAEPDPADELDYSNVPVTPATATVVTTPRATQQHSHSEIVPSDTGEKAVGTKGTKSYVQGTEGAEKLKGGTGDARPGTAKRAEGKARKGSSKRKVPAAARGTEPTAKPTG